MMKSRFEHTKRKSEITDIHILVDPDDNKTNKPKSRENSNWCFAYQRLLLRLRARNIQVAHLCILFALIILTMKRSTNNSMKKLAYGIDHENLWRYYKSHPLMLRYDDPSTNKARHTYVYDPGRKIESWTKEDEEGQEGLKDEEWYDKDNRRPFEVYKNDPESDPNCQPMHEWQLHDFPACNTLHEQAMDNEKSGKLLAHGWWRQTFQIYDPGTDHPIALKTLRNKRTFDRNVYERHRVDAVIYDRTRASPWIMNIYGHCGVSGLFEYADGGNLMDLVYDRKGRGKDPLDRIDKLALAVEVSSAIASLHATESRNGYSSIVHSDIALDQFVWAGNRFKLNDFNRGHLMYWNEEKQENCPYHWTDGNPGPNRSPEEYKEDWQTEKIDVFSLGNIIYGILTESEPHEDAEGDDKVVYHLVKEGVLPPLDRELLQSEHPVDRALVQALNMCFEYDWRERARAVEVRDLLIKALEEEKNNHSRTRRRRNRSEKRN